MIGDVMAPAAGLSTTAIPIAGAVMGGLQLASSIFGGLGASSASKSAMNAAKGANYSSIMGSGLQNALADYGQRPYQDIGAYAAPLYQWMTTGIRPEAAWTAEDQRKYEALAALENDLRADFNTIQAMTSSTGSKSTRRGGLANMDSITKQLTELEELKSRYRAKTALGGITDPQQLVQQNPLYAWQQQQGEQGINRALAARGMHNSSAGINALSRFNESLNANERGRMVNDLYNAINVGRGASSTIGSTGMQSANMQNNVMANYMPQVANAYGQNAAAQGGMVQGAANALGSAFGNYMGAQSPFQQSSSGAYIGQYNPAYNGGITPDAWASGVRPPA